MKQFIKDFIRNSKLTSGIYKRLYPYYLFLRHDNEVICLTKKGVNAEGKILQISHRLERGICLSHGGSRKLCWGYRKATELVDLLVMQRSIRENDAVKIGEASLSAFIKEKEKCTESEEISNLNHLKEKMQEANIRINPDDSWGGVLSLNKEDLAHGVKDYENIFYSRHSIREFSDEPVSTEKLKKAVELAWRAPNSCNRQATEIYVLDGEAKEIAVKENNMNADKFLIVCGRMDFFSTDEAEDWLVNTGIFCGYLSLALHAVGIGHCLIRKNVIFKNAYNDELRRICKIPDNQKIILEIAIGNYKDEFIVPVSKRKSIEEALHFIN